MIVVPFFPSDRRVGAGCTDAGRDGAGAGDAATDDGAGFADAEPEPEVVAGPAVVEPQPTSTRQIASSSAFTHSVCRISRAARQAEHPIVNEGPSCDTAGHEIGIARHFGRPDKLLAGPKAGQSESHWPAGRLSRVTHALASEDGVDVSRWV